MDSFFDSSNLIPEQSYLYFPRSFDEKMGEEKNGLRRIFEGQVEFDSFEKKIIESLKKIIFEQKLFGEMEWKL